MKVFTTVFKNGKKEKTINEYKLVREEKGVENSVVDLFPEIEYQRWIGFGGAITDAAGYVYTKLSDEDKKKVIDLYYGKDGNRYNMVRSHIDSCDFSVDMYCAMNDPEDRDMKSFTLERDEKYILPLMKAAQDKVGDGFDIMLTPWSPPAFMKTNNSRIHGGKLMPEYHQFWADYFCRYIKEYEKRGFKVNRITIQNEPQASQTWDSCIFSPEEEKAFMKDYLYPTFVKNGLGHVKINIWDHNKERMVEWGQIIIDEETDKMVDGIAFHWYSGDHFESIDICRELFPNKELIFTESCIEYSRFDTDDLRNARMYAHDIIGDINGGMTAFIDWNILLDKQGGPNHVGNFCDAPIMVDTETGEYVTKLSFDYIGHFSKYIEKDARRIGFSKPNKDIEMTAFKNPDGSIVAVVLNPTDKEMPIHLRINGDIVSFVVPGDAIATAII